MKTQSDIINWLRKGSILSYRKIEIEDSHSSRGILQINLCQHYWTICSGIGNTIEEAFTEAESLFEASLKKRLEECVQYAKRERDRNLGYYNDQVEKAQKALDALWNKQ
jgi:hypothetical protein